MTEFDKRNRSREIVSVDDDIAELEKRLAQEDPGAPDN